MSGNITRKHRKMLEAATIIKTAAAQAKEDEIAKYQAQLEAEYRAINQEILDELDDEEPPLDSVDSIIDRITNAHLGTISSIMAMAAYANYVATSENLMQSVSKYETFPQSDFLDKAKDYVNTHFYERGKMETILNNYKNTLSQKMQDGIDSGDNWQDIYSDFKDAIKDPDFLDYQTERIVRTELAMAMEHSALDAARATGLPMVARFLVDASSCDVCQELAADSEDGLDLNDPDVGSLPHPNCVIEGTIVIASDVRAIYKRPFRGEVIVIQTASNGNVTVTPNHPILTKRGWIAAKDLKVGDCVAQSISPIRFNSRVNPKNNYMESPIENVFNSAMVQGHVVVTRMPTTAKDFHGDGIDGEVDVVLVDGGFSVYFKKFFKIVINWLLGTAEWLKVILPVLGSFYFRLQRINPTSGGFIRFLGYGLSLLSGKFSHSVFSLLVKVTDRKPKPFKIIRDGVPVYSEIFAYIQRRFTSAVSFVKVSNLTVREFEGHVYNLSTKRGFYFANGIVTHNCTDEWIYEVDESQLPDETDNEVVTDGE